MIAENVFKILDALPKQKDNNSLYWASTTKTTTIATIVSMRGSILEVVTKKVDQMNGNPDEPIAQTDMLGFLVEANRAGTKYSELFCSAAKLLPHVNIRDCNNF